MPSAKKVSWAQLRIGILAMVAMAILATLIFLLTGNTSFFESKATLHTYMDDSAGMTTGTPVRLNGILVGDISDVKLSGSKDPKRIVEIEMSVKGKYIPDIPDDSIAGVSAANLLGDKFINITKGVSPRHVEPGGELRSLQVQDIPELMAQSANILTQFQTILGRVDRLLGDVEAGRGNIGKLLKDEELYARLNGTISEAQQIVSDIRRGHGTISRLLYDDTLYQEVRAPIQRLNDLLNELQQGKGSAGKLLKDPGLYDDVRKTTAAINALLADLNAGKGTAGKLLKDDELYRKFSAIVTKFDTTIDRINSGQGTLGQLLVNPQLYESLNGATGEMHQLFKDMRANPKKFLRIKLALF